MIVEIVILIIFVYFIRLLYPRKKYNVGVQVERTAVVGLATLDDVDAFEDDVGVAVLNGETKNCGKFAARCAALAKIEFGVLERTVVNRRIVRRFIRDFMVEHGVRKSHILNTIEIAVNLVFIKSRGELHAEQLMSTQAIQEREVLSSSRWISGLTDLCEYIGFSKA